MTPITFTITGELSEQGLLNAKAELEELLARQGLPTIVGNPEEVAARKACALAQRAGDTTWRFVSRVAHGYEPEHEFTFEDLRSVFSVTVESIKSWHRNMARTAKSIDKEMGAEPRFFEARWDGARQHYWLTDVMREALLAADLERRANRL
jgi:hypothetical protein